MPTPLAVERRPLENPPICLLCRTPLDVMKKTPQPKNFRKSKSRRLVGFLFCAITLALTLAAAWYWNRPGEIMARWQERLAALPDDRIEPELRRIAALGDRGMPVLAAAVGSTRGEVESASRGVLLDEMEHWRQLDAEQARGRLSVLADSLVEAMPHYDRPTKRFAADLALRILHWPHGDDGPARAALVAKCEALLSAAAERRRDVAQTDEAPPSNGSATTGASRPITSTTSASRLPGGDLPLELADVTPPVARLAAKPAEEIPSAVEPNPLPNGTAVKSIEVATDPIEDDIDQTPAANQPRRLPSGDEARPGTRLASAQTAIRAPDQSAAGQTASTINWNELRIRELMHKLDAGNPDLAAAARRELENRGVKGPLVELARQMADPKPAVRLQLAESLPKQAGLDARPWLLELSYDEDPSVRAAAVTLMATSGDRDLLNRVRQVALDDPDDHTRAQAEKALPNSKRRR